MGAVLALSWREGASAEVGRSIVAAARQAGYTEVRKSPFGWIGVAGPRPPRLHDLRGGLFVVGDLFSVSGGPVLEMGGRLERLKGLVASYWGRYVAIDLDGDGTLRAALRDPSGAAEVALWTSDSVQILSTGVPDWLMRAAPATVSVIWEGVPVLLGNALAGLTQPPLNGLTVLDAGEMIDLDTGHRSQVWRPVGDKASDIWDPVAAREGLRQRVETCVDALAGDVTVPGAELSGGLDSAIVAVALGRHRPRVGLWLNAHSFRAETDERRYARSVAAYLHVPLTELQRLEQALEADVLNQTSDGVRPGYNGSDPVFDALVAEACQTRGLDGLFTGKGGDALFYQGGSGAIFADLWRAKGLAAVGSPVLTGVARWRRRSVWSVFAEAVTQRQPDAIPVDPGILAEPVATPVVHPWLHGGESLGPGKRLQLHALISNLAYVTACRRTAAVDLIHPLMSQPLVEWAMRLPTPILTGGITDRHLARSAFADSLPAEVVWRRSKGDYTATFEREAAASLPFLKTHLLDGLLAQRGIIDRGRTEALLDRDRLMWAGGSHHLSSAALVESWLRRWTARAT